MAKRDRRIPCECTNMIMLRRKDEFVAILRELSWKGVSMPGGHVEKGESFYASAVREAYEETGLIVHSMRLAAIVNWCKRGTNERYIVYLYESTDYSGDLKDRTNEGRVFYTTLEELESGKYPLAGGTLDYVKTVLTGRFTELFCEYDDSGDGEMRNIPC